MFYSRFVLTKKGPLGKVWIAATLGEARIPKSFATNAKIQVLCQNIEQPAVPFALRLSASLMLGVVRIFSRKSNIMLSDVNAILTMLSNYTRTKGSAHNHKRAYDAQMAENTQQYVDNISLSGDKGIASYDAITMPVAKRCRRRGVNDDKISWDAIPNVAALGSNAAPWAPTLQKNELDVFVAMDTIFPSVLVPQHTELPLNITASPESSLNRSSSRQPFHAREEDITLHPTGDIFENAAISPISQRGVGLTGFSKTSSGNHAIVRSLFHRENSDERGQQEMLSYQSVPNDEVPMVFRDDLYPPKPTTLPQIQLTPFQRRSAGNLLDENGSKERNLNERVIGQSPHKLELEQGSFSKKSVRKLLDARKTINDELSKDPQQSYRQDVSNEISEVFEEKLVNSDEDPVNREANAVDVRGLNRPRKTLTKVIFDEKTELSTQDFRNFLHDTTDIVLGPREKRVRAIRPRKNRQKFNLLTSELPSFVRGFSKDLHTCWEEVVGIKNQPAANQARDKQAHQGSKIRNIGNLANIISDQERVINFGNGTPAGTKNVEATPGAQGIFFNPADGLTSIDPVRVADNGNRTPPLTDPGAQPRAGERDSSSEEKMRAIDDHDGGISIPSVSIADRSGSISGPSATRSGERQENLRDRIFDMITPADVKSYERAKQQSGNIRKSMAWESSDAIPLPQPFGNDSERQSLPMPNAPGSIEERNPGLFDVHTSDLQLAEETEKDDILDGANRGPIDAIGIRAFKLLELMRTQDRQHASVLVDASTLTKAENPLTTADLISLYAARTGLIFIWKKFDELMSGCSRLVRARTFYHLISLVNCQFVRAKQEKPYGPITLAMGTFF